MTSPARGLLTQNDKNHEHIQGRVMSAKRNTAFNTLPRFIWGEAVSETGFSQHEYLINTRYPRFIATVYDNLMEGRSPDAFESQLGNHPETGELVYVTSLELGFKDWVFLDSGQIDMAKLKEACDAAVGNYMMRDEYGIRK